MRTSQEEFKEYLAYFVQGVLAISPSIFKIIMSRERSIDVSSDSTVLRRLLLEKKNIKMEMKTHQKNINYKMLGLRVRRLALCSACCSKFNQTGSTQSAGCLQAGSSGSTPSWICFPKHSWERPASSSTRTHRWPRTAAQPEPSLGDPSTQTLPRHAVSHSAPSAPGSCLLPSKALALAFSWRNHPAAPTQNYTTEKQKTEYKPKKDAAV